MNEVRVISNMAVTFIEERREFLNYQGCLLGHRGSHTLYPRLRCDCQLITVEVPVLRNWNTKLNEKMRPPKLGEMCNVFEVLNKVQYNV